jgi:hypothetical protein
MKGLIVAILAIALVGVAPLTASAAKPQTYTFTLMSNEDGRSNVTGTVRLQTAGGKTMIHVSAKGLRADATYVLTYSTSGDCATGAVTLTNYTTKGNGNLIVTTNTTADLSSIGSIGIRADTDTGTLVACATTSP